MLCITPATELIAPDTINSFYGGNIADGRGRTALEFLHVFKPTNKPFEAAVTPLLQAHQDYIIRKYCNYPLK